MTWITVTWPMVAAACLTLGLIELRIALIRPFDLARALFSSSAFAAAAACGFELAMMHADGPVQFQALLNAFDVAAGIVIASLAAFVLVYFGCGNKWLAIAGPAVYFSAVVFDFVPGSSLGYLEMTGVKTIDTFGGASYNVAVGVPNPLNALTYLGVLMLLVFVVHASVQLARHGQRRRALVIGGSVAFWALAAGTHSALIEAGVLQMPYMISLAFLIFLLAMAHELTVDVAAAARLGGELLESERRMALAGEAAALGVWVWKLDSDEVWANAGARALYGLADADRLNQAKFVAAVHADDRDAVRRAVESSFATDCDLEIEHRVQGPAGATRWIATRGRVERGASSVSRLMRGVALDVSARRRSEMELQQLQTQLAHTGRVSMLGQLSSALAHELYQPLGAILRNAEAAELFLQREPPDLDEVHTILADIRADDQRARDVIERLRTLLKRRSMEFQPVAMVELFADTLALTRADAAARGIRVEVAVDDGLPAVSGDRVHLQQVLLNLVLNAMDAIERAPSGGERRVVLRAEARGERDVEVAVSDSGHGITPRQAGHVFEPFFTTKANGMGVGLAISRTIVEAHGGRIWVDGSATAGATFRFTLPIDGERSAS